MPFHIVKVPGGYMVENKETKRRYSLHPLKLSVAKKQLSALYIYIKT